VLCGVVPLKVHVFRELVQSFLVQIDVFETQITILLNLVVNPKLHKVVEEEIVILEVCKLVHVVAPSFVFILLLLAESGKDTVVEFDAIGLTFSHQVVVLIFGLVDEAEHVDHVHHHCQQLLVVVARAFHGTEEVPHLLALDGVEVLDLDRVEQLDELVALDAVPVELLDQCIHDAVEVVEPLD